MNGLTVNFCPGQAPPVLPSGDPFAPTPAPTGNPVTSPILQPSPSGNIILNLNLLDQFRP